jgi:spore coat protein U domain-containing protein, fimbrial subunit CupE1/2/3/6
MGKVHLDMNTYWRSLLILGAILFVAPGKAVAASCTVNGTTINFGNVNVLDNTVTDSTGTITVDCSNVGGGNKVRHCVSIGAGTPAGDATSRKMGGPGASQLRFDLYANNARTVPWGSWVTGYHGAGVEFQTNKNASNTGTVYGRVYLGQSTVQPGTYTSTFSSDLVNEWVENPPSGACPSYPGLSPAYGSFTVTATVISSCIVSATNINFGSAGVIAGNVDAAGAVTVKCTNGTAFNVGLSEGLASGATVTSRKMTSGTKTISYSLFRNSIRTSNWGNTPGTDTVSGTGAGSDAVLTVYGRVPAQTTPAPGTYSDTVVVSVYY